MTLFKPGFPTFSAIADFLGILEADGATTEYENGPVKPRLDVSLAIQKTAVWRTFILIVSNVGAITSTLELDFRTNDNWDAIRQRNREAFNPVPLTHEILVVGVGGMVSANGNVTSFSLVRRLVAVVGPVNHTLFFADAGTDDATMTRGSENGSPVLVPLPWYFPLADLSDQAIRSQFITTGNATLSMSFNVLSAPPGVFSRIWG